MSSLQKSINRDRERNKRKYGHRRDGDSTKLIMRINKKRRDQSIAKGRKKKEEFIDRITKESYNLEDEII